MKAINKEVIEMIDEKDEWLAMGVRSSKAEKYNLFWINWLKQRAEKGVRARILFVDKGTEYYDQLKKIKRTQVGYLKGIAPSAVTVIKNRVMIFNYGDYPSCLAITNKEIASSFKEFFETLWMLAEKEK